MDALQIKAFIDAMASSDLAEMEVDHEGWTLKLVRRPGAAAAPAASAAARAPARAAQRSTAPAPAALPREVHAPLFGVVHLTPEPGAAPFVVEGQSVRAGQTLAVIEAMKVFNQVLADRDGVVDALLVQGGTEVEAGQPLLRFR